ncbi:DUF1648 domain-containing protein [Cellulomonas fimi]|uniref:DUF1648 domain-containing protein n=1 Tax=Cellulomonas fimi TaxID=1708 RepID=UPI00234DCB9F|nr:DUF1648 domain-containing protein [Cellulomonas fimi]MDC7122183.1 DUF1648 domain-containing protein [Cellulomonas fimi]
MTADRRPTIPHRRATTLVTLVAPVVLTAVAVLVALTWADELPDPVATHWGTAGTPDDFSTLGGALLLLGLTSVVLSLSCWVLALRLGAEATTRRVAAGTSVGMAALLAVLVVGSLALQRGLDDARDAGPITGVVAAAFATGLVLGVVAALLLPGDPDVVTSDVPPADAARLPLAPGERAAWTASVWSPAAIGVALPVIALQVVLSIVLDTWLLLAIAAVLAALLATMLVLRVTVSAAGLVARSPLGWPRVRVPLEQVVAAHAETVSPLRDFGGWGYRVALDGRAGFVLRAGDALVVERTGGRTTVVTVDDAATGAALLNTLAERARVS